MRNAFALEHPSDGGWVLWVQAHNGYFMLLAGGWPTRAIAEKVAEGFGYTLCDSKRGIAVVARQMTSRPDLYSQQSGDVSRVLN